MKLELVSSYSNSAGTTGGNHYATETWSGEIAGKNFTVTLNSMSAPTWEGDELDWDERTEVMNELSQLSSL